VEQKQTLIRANIAHFPTATQAYEADLTVIKDGALVLSGDKILALGSYVDMRDAYRQATTIDYSGKWLFPGFIDSHLHFPQTEIIAKYGEKLLTWLENYTFPTERKFAERSHSDKLAEHFLKQCLKNGTTTGLVFSSVHKEATESLFQAASNINMMTIAGKVCMDNNCPIWLQDTPDSAQKDSAKLIEKWHGKGRNYYALTPRFAPTSSRAQMAAIGELAQQFPDLFIQTHLSENTDEIAWVKSIYPEFDDYLAVYEHYHMVRPRAVYGHCIHLSDNEWQRMAASGAVAAFCPSSNLFLGSGLFDLAKAHQHRAAVTLASDVGGGTSFNMLRNLGEAYKVCQLNNYSLSPYEGLYMLTQGAASAFGLDDKIGNLNPGSDADFVVLNPYFDDLTQVRIDAEASCDDVVFALSILADDRATQATWIAGKAQYDTTQESPYAMD
jgi:guanine deaminase